MSDIEKRLQALENALFGYSGTYWHETGILSDGASFGRIGAMTHIIDSETKRPMSGGYHTIKAVGCGRYEVSRGAWTGEIRVD